MLQRIINMVAIMICQTIVLGMGVGMPHIFYLFFAMWWVLAGLFWWQFYKAWKGIK